MALMNDSIAAYSSGRIFAFALHRGRKVSLSMLLLPLLAGCTATAWSEKIRIDQTPMPTECAGWQKIEMKQRTSLFLMREDPNLVINVDSHNLKGRHLGCWQ